MDSLNGDTFVDILENRRKGNDMSWALKDWEGSTCRYSLQRTPQDIKTQVLKSSKLKQIIQELSIQKGCPYQDIEAEAKQILEEMSHDFNMRTIRFFGYTLSKFMKSVYGKILVNDKGVEKISNMATQYPILYLPTHRSYSDFLLVSYICFYYNLPLPAIAAGLDFLGLKFLSFLLRGAGAFFIRRSFIGDQLYKAIFAEYVQSHVEGCEFPLEFFIEGTRSRSAKSLVPKLGMMQTILDLYFSSKVSDITVVPISISYDRTLEETLYAYELLGVPKPKESTTGLIKARKVMSDYFGNVYVRFGEPISLKEYFRNYDRSIHNQFPRYMSVVLKDEHRMCRDLTHHIVRMHQCNLILSPFPLVCLLLCQPQTGAIHINLLVDQIYWLEELIRRTGALIYTGHGNLSKSVPENLQIHSNVVEIRDDLTVTLKNSEIKHPTASSTAPRLRNSTLRKAIPAMFAYHYGNQALQLLVHNCMICVAMVTDLNGIHLQDDVFYRYNVLRKLLQRDFVFEKDTSEKDFLHALQSLREENIVSVENLKLQSLPSATEKVELLASMLLPFLEGYTSIVQCILGFGDSALPSCKHLPLECQAFIERAIVAGAVTDYRCLSLDVVNNCVALLVSHGALTKDQQGNFVSSQAILVNFMSELEMFLPSSSKQGNIMRLPLPAAKL